MSEIEKVIYSRLKGPNEMLCRKNDDDVISVMRMYDWNVKKFENEWFGDK